jgi:hypothetical protein
MFRIALAIYLTLAFLVSPCLCCCGGGRMVAAPDSEIDSGGSLDSSLKVATICCGCRTTGVACENDASAIDSESPCEKHPCPARRHHDQSVIVAGPGGSTIVGVTPPSDRYTFDAMVGDRGNAPSSGPVLVDGLRDEPVTFPCHSGREILCLICVMRC